MGKILIEFGIPALVLSFVSWKLVKIWFYSVVPSHLKEAEKLKKAGDKYEKVLDKLDKD